MPRLQAIESARASDKAKELLGEIEARLGMVPNVMRTLSNSPAALHGCVALSGALEQGVLCSRVRERLALTVSEANGCDYCIAAHGALAAAVGLSEEDIQDSRRGVSPDSKVEAVLRFARQIVDKRGGVSDGDVAQVRKAGWDDAEITEVVANVALNVYTNYFNRVAETEMDFPEASSPRFPDAVYGRDLMWAHRNR